MQPDCRSRAMNLIDYKNPDELSAVRSICIGCLTANIGAIISLTLIEKQSEDLQLALAYFAASLPLLGCCATALDLAFTSLAAGRRRSPSGPVTLSRYARSLDSLSPIADI